MPANNPHVKALVEAGLDRRPTRSLGHLLAEHGSLLMAVKQARPAVEQMVIAEARDARLDRASGHKERDLYWAMTLAAVDVVIARCEAPTADRSAA